MIWDHGAAGNYSLFFGPTWSGQPKVAAWYNTGAIQDVDFVQSMPSATSNGTQNCPALLAAGLINVTGRKGDDVLDTAQVGNIPWQLIGGGRNGLLLAGAQAGRKSGFATSVVPFVNDAAVTQGYCLVADDLYNVHQYSGSGIVVALATQSMGAPTTGNTSVVVGIENGVFNFAVNTSSVAIAQNAILVPHSSGGIAAGSFGSAQVIGRALARIGPLLGAPGAATLAAASGAGLGIGAYLYQISFQSVSGETTGGTEASVTTTSGNQQVSLTAIPTGPTGTTKRRIYRAAVGGASGTEKLVATLNDTRPPPTPTRPQTDRSARPCRRRTRQTSVRWS